MRNLNQPEKRKRFLLYPKDVFTVIWNIIISIVLLYVTFIMTFEMAFIEEIITFFIITEYIVTVIFGLDIIVNFNKAFTNKKGKLITCRKKIVKRYLKGWFVLDLISFFPFFVFNKLNNDFGLIIGFKTLKILKILNIVRLIRLVKIIKKLTINQFRDPSNQFKKNLKKNYERLAIHCILILISCHVFGCLFYFIPRIASPEENWVVNRNLENHHYIHKYLYSIHWIIETIITVGYGEVPIRYAYICGQ